MYLVEWLSTRELFSMKIEKGIHVRWTTKRGNEIDLIQLNVA